MRLHRFIIPAMVILLLAPGLLHGEVPVKIRDLTYMDGLKANQLVGYGIVVGLEGTGDSGRTPVAADSLKNLLKNLGMESEDLRTRNTAAVIITAQLPPYVRVGDRVDVTVSSIGDARSLEGGILVQSPLRGGDDRVYVVAQGRLSSSVSTGTNRPVKTVAVIKKGGIIERAIEPEVVQDNSVTLVLRDWDFTVAKDIMEAISEKYPEANPRIVEGSKIRLSLVQDVGLAEFLSTIENMEISPGTRAKVVISEQDGTIVTGGEVKLSEAMVSKEGVTVKVRGSDREVSVSHLKESATVQDLVEALNAIGATTKDIISIMKALSDAGSLHAELIIK
jgi:flagellar P-ring protein precursor FlgI